MDQNTILPILKKIPLFADLNEEDHKEIIKQITLEYYPTNKLLFSHGEDGDAMYIIKSGLVKIFHTEDSSEKELAVLGANEFFGEMALISDKKRIASAITLEECEIFKLRKSDFKLLISTNQHLAIIISDAILKRVKSNNKSY